MLRGVYRFIIHAMMILLVFTYLTSCGTLRLTPAVSTVTNSLKLYNPAFNELHPDYVVHHSKADASTLYFRLLTKELLFNQANPETRDQSRVLLQYKLFSSFSDQIIDHRGEQEFVINKDEVGDNYLGHIDIPTEEGKSYLLEIFLTDQIRQLSSKRMILVDRFNPKSQQYYLIVSYPGNEVAFERFFYPEERFRVVTQNPPASGLKIAYYKPIQDIPAPPYDVQVLFEDTPEPDSVWTTRNPSQNLFRLEQEGLYQLFPDQENMNGVYVTNFGNSYPQVRTSVEMIPPLAYIATADELRKISENPDSKQAVDEFWLERGGSFSVARELIKVYYNRIVFANLYFSSDREGYLTDRGMIYVMMGPPDLVNKSETGESWVYKQSGSNQKYTFDFYLASDPIMGYDFALKRSENHRVPWNMAVQSWREGRIFSLK